MTRTPPRHGRLAILGASGHGRVVADAATRAGYAVVGFLDRDPATAPRGGIPVLGDEAQLEGLIEAGIAVVIAIGETAVRRAVVERLAAHWPGLRFAAVVHPAAVIAPYAEVGPGAMVLAGAILNPGARAGAHAIINTGAIVEHDCRVGPFATVGPRACIGGASTVGEGAIIGLGASVIHQRTIGDHALVGAGAVVVDDVPSGAVVVGVPARVVRQRDPADLYLQRGD